MVLNETEMLEEVVVEEPVIENEKRIIFSSMEHAIEWMLEKKKEYLLSEAEQREKEELKKNYLEQGDFVAAISLESEYWIGHKYVSTELLGISLERESELKREILKNEDFIQALQDKVEILFCKNILSLQKDGCHERDFMIFLIDRVIDVQKDVKKKRDLLVNEMESLKAQRKGL